MVIRKTALVIALGVAAFAGRARAVINGAPDPQDPAVVSLAACTGTLVAPQVILTAAHCVVDAWPEDLQISFGGTRAASASRTRVIEIRLHPLYDRYTEDDDLALLLIDPPITDVPPLPLLTTPLDDSKIGAPLRVVGYGQSVAGDVLTDGAKREGTIHLAAYLYAAFTDTASPQATCKGDSGGPVLLDVGGTEFVAGVTSRGNDTCTTFGVKTRVDTFVADFIQPYVGATSPGGTPTGAHCVYDRQCANGDTCLAAKDDPIVRYCSHRCTSEAGCPTALNCSEGFCRHPEPTPSAVGSYCVRDSDCASTLCSHALPQAPLVCTTQCKIDGIGCNEGFECAADARGDGTSICVRSDQRGAPSGCAVARPRAAGSPLPELFSIVLLLLWRPAARTRELGNQ